MDREISYAAVWRVGHDWGNSASKNMTHMNLSMKINWLTDIENRIVVHKGLGGRRMHWDFEIADENC